MRLTVHRGGSAARARGKKETYLLAAHGQWESRAVIIDVKNRTAEQTGWRKFRVEYMDLLYSSAHNVMCMRARSSRGASSFLLDLTGGMATALVGALVRCPV